MNQISNLEKIILKTGFGLYYKFLIGFTSATNFSEAMILTTFRLVLPLMACDLPLSQSAIMGVNVVYSIGTAFGCFIYCALSDVFGRKHFVPILCGFIFSSVLTCSFVQSSFVLYLFVLTLASGLEANTKIIKIHLVETLPLHRRGFFLIFSDLFWSLGFYISIIMVWILGPLTFTYYNNDARFFSWRMILALSSITSIFVGCASNLTRPSIRYLLYTGNFNEALKNLKDFFAMNKSKNSEDFLVTEEQLQMEIKSYGAPRNVHPQADISTCNEIIDILYRSMKATMSKPFTRVTFILIFLKIITSNSLQYNGNCSMSGLDILHLETSSEMCDLKLDGDLFRDFLLLGMSISFGQGILLILIEKVRRKHLILFSYLISGVLSMMLAFLEIPGLKLMRITLMGMFLALYSLLDSIITLVLIESYPTALRGMAVGETHFLANILNIFIRKYLAAPCQICFIAGGIFLEVGAMITTFLPDYTGAPMME